MMTYLFICLMVCLYSINIKTNQPIEPKFYRTSYAPMKGL